jgi:hypothetical protein
MHIIVYQHTEKPLVLEQVYRIDHPDESDVVTIYDRVDGRLEFDPEDIIKFEGPNGTD